MAMASELARAGRQRSNDISTTEGHSHLLLSNRHSAPRPFSLDEVIISKQPQILFVRDRLVYSIECASRQVARKKLLAFLEPHLLGTRLQIAWLVSFLYHLLYSIPPIEYTCEPVSVSS